MTKTVLRRALSGTSPGLPWVGVVAFTALAVACGGTDRQPISPVAPGAVPEAAMSATEATGLAAQSNVARHLTGMLDGRFDFTNLWGTEWWQFYSDSDTSGTVSHLGLTRLHTRHIPNLNTGALDDGEFTILAANGDEIHGAYEGSAAYDPDRADLIHGTATFVVSGGTGRFAGATGSLTVTFLETLDDPTWASAKVSWTLEGMVTY
jgi:hypothetical protein